MHQGAATHFAEQREMQSKLDNQQLSMSRALTDLSPRSRGVVAEGTLRNQSPDAKVRQQLSHAHRTIRDLERENKELRQRQEDFGSPASAGLKGTVNNLRKKLSRAETEVFNRLFRWCSDTVLIVACYVVCPSLQ